MDTSLNVIITNIFKPFQDHINAEQDIREEIRNIMKEIEKSLREIVTQLQVIHHKENSGQVNLACLKSRELFEDIRVGYSRLDKIIPEGQYYRYNDHWKYPTQRSCFLAALIVFLEKGLLIDKDTASDIIGCLSGHSELKMSNENVGQLREFHVINSDWLIYKRRLENYFIANTITDNLLGSIKSEPQVLEGNINTYLEVKRELDLPIWATKVRFYPYSYHKRTVCMRIELYGCTWTGGILSYSMPQGDKRGFNWEFYDFAYDGHWEGDHLRDGLGQLVDGKFGQDDFKTEFYNEGQAWVGWKNDTKYNDYIDIKFEFDNVREFSSLHIYCNNQFTKDVQVFSAVKVLFSIGGKYFNHVEPIIFEYMEDCIFENARNISVKLYHRVGRFVNIQIYFSSKWLMISEITFDSIIAHGNFSFEPEPTTIFPSTRERSDVYLFKNDTLSNEKVGKPTYLTSTVVALIFFGILLKLFIFIVYRKRIKKFVRTSNSSHAGYATDACSHLQNDSIYGMNGKGRHIESYSITEIDGCKRVKATKTSIRSTAYLSNPGNQDECNEYQEPYQAMRYASYYTYSPVLTDMKESYPELTERMHHSIADAYDYAIPEARPSPLSGRNESTLFLPRIRFSSIASRNVGICSSNSKEDFEASLPTQQQTLSGPYTSLEENILVEFPRQRLKMISKLSEGAFGTLYIAEADGILEYSSSSSLGMRLVAIKFLREVITEKKYFHRDVKILAALQDPNLARVLGICTQEDPMCVIFEYLDYGDLCQFLRTHVLMENCNSNLYRSKILSHSSLLYMGTQVAKGMRYLESLNFVHRDLATRNCLIGKSFQVKICDFGTHNKVYANDYFKVDGSTPLPIRWMAWEAVFHGQYTIKSDVWSFAVLLWEILTLAGEQPYNTLSDRKVMENLASLIDNKINFFHLHIPTNDQDIHKLMLECWKRNPTERLTFVEIHSFLQCKILGYAPS